MTANGPLTLDMIATGGVAVGFINFSQETELREAFETTAEAKLPQGTHYSVRKRNESGFGSDIERMAQEAAYARKTHGAETPFDFAVIVAIPGRPNGGAAEHLQQAFDALLLPLAQKGSCQPYEIVYEKAGEIQAQR